MKKYKYWLAIVLLVFSTIAGFTSKERRYEGTNFISKLDIPYIISDWAGKNVTEALNLDFEKDWTKFISEALAYEYTNNQGEKLIFIILDAGNLHNPKACFTSAGFKIKDLDYTEFHTSGRTIKAHTLYTERETDSFLSFYWIVIDKNVAHQWLEQKLKQLYFSLFNKKRVGLMIRIDIPAKEDDIEDATTMAKQFTNDLGSTLHPEKADYIFGKK